MNDTDKAKVWSRVITAIVILWVTAMASYTIITVYRSTHPPAAEARP